MKSLPFHIPEAWKRYLFGGFGVSVSEPLRIVGPGVPPGLQETTNRQTQGRSMYVKSFQNAELIFRTCFCLLPFPIP